MTLAALIEKARRAVSEHALEEVRLVARAETISACATLARVYEAKGADAGIVRFQLEQRADEAWTRVEAHHHTPDPLEAGATESKGACTASAHADRKPLPRVAPASSGAAGLTADDSSTVPLTDEQQLQLLARGMDLAIRALSGPEPRSLRAVEPPTLRVVE